jgi:sialate O-acetylesterase
MNQDTIYRWLRKACFLFVTGIFIHSNAMAQKDTVWHNKKCAVVITYDDALNVHLDNAVPLLDSLGMKATFYLTAYAPGCSHRLADWKRVAANGHELGNHTLYHPCIGDLPGREWVNTNYDMSKYSVRRIVDEIRMTNVFLEALDGRTKRTFAFTCADTKVGDSSFTQYIAKDFTGLRNVREQMHTIGQVNLYDVDCYAINGQDGDYMINLVKKAMDTNSLLVFLFHGVGGEHPINVSLPAHRQLLQFLKQNEKDVWIAPMTEVAEYVKNYQSKRK